jgi:uncharacterized protein (UPF0179 family)
MVTVTLISEPLAKEKGRFYYIGPQPECESCKVKKVCSNLEPGSMYEISSIRDQTHDCALNEDKVKVVEVTKIAQTAAVPKKSAIEGGLITFKEQGCGRLDCKNYILCNPYALESGRKCSVTEICGDMECLIGEKLVTAKLL